MQGVFWAEQLLLKDQTEKELVYFFYVVSTLPASAPTAYYEMMTIFFFLMLFFVSDQMSLQLTNKVLSELLLFGPHGGVTKPPNQRQAQQWSHARWREKLSKSWLGLC